MNPGTASDDGRQTEVWLRTNRRALLIGVAFVGLIVLAAASAIVISGQFWFGPALQIGGWATLGLGSLLVLMLVYQMRLPRLAYCNGHLLVYLKSAEPERVPIEIVELFFFGQGVSHLPANESEPSKSRTVVVRLAEAAAEWHARDVNPNWGEWREGYIILRGTWCEPLTPDVMKDLNRRLREVHRARASANAEATL